MEIGDKVLFSYGYRWYHGYIVAIVNGFLPRAFINSEDCPIGNPETYLQNVVLDPEGVRPEPPTVKP